MIRRRQSSLAAGGSDSSFPPPLPQHSSTPPKAGGEPSSPRRSVLTQSPLFGGRRSSSSSSSLPMAGRILFRESSTEELPNGYTPSKRRSSLSSSRSVLYPSSFSVHNNNDDKNFIRWLIPALLWIVLPWMPVYFGSILPQNRAVTLYQDLHDLHAPLLDELQQATQEVQRLQGKTLIVEQENALLFAAIRDKDMLEMENYQAVEALEEAMVGQMDRLEAYIQKWDKERVIEKYGPGPHRVELSVAPPKATMPAKLVLELAPVEELPHAIAHFMKMVHARVWNGLTLVLDHDSLTATLRDATTGEWQGRRFFQTDNLKNLELTQQMVFTEYSKEYPPAGSSFQYTVSFTGRPGGPGFHIHLTHHHHDHEDNDNDVDILSSTHVDALVDRFHHDEEAIFGRVVDGTESLERWVKNYPRMQPEDRFLQIKNIKILSSSSSK